MMETLIDTIMFEPRILEKSDDGIMRIEGVFQRADTKNANGRVYSRKLWERILGKDSPVMQRMGSRALLGHLEHPVDGVTDLRKGTLITTNLKIDEKGQVVGTAELLDTPDGKIAQEYVNKGIRVGISSRGKGSVGANGQVSDDYMLEAFDLVYNPSTPGAHPKAALTSKTESVEDGEIADDTDKEGLPMSEAIARLEAFESRVNLLTEQSVDGMPAYQLADLSGRLLETSVQLGDLAAKEPALQEPIRGIQDRINAKRAELRKVDEGAVQGDEDASNGTPLELAEGADDDTDDGSALGVIIEGAAEELDANTEQLVASEDLFEEMAKSLKEAEARAEQTSLLLEAAVALISELTASNPADEVAEAVEAVIEANPNLGGVVEILVECSTAGEVFEKAELLSNAIGAPAEDAEDGDDDDEDADVDEGSEFPDDDDLFEGIDEADTTLASEDEVSVGILEGSRDDDIAANHKGHKLAVVAESRIQGR